VCRATDDLAEREVLGEVVVHEVEVFALVAASRISVSVM